MELDQATIDARELIVSQDTQFLMDAIEYDKKGNLLYTTDNMLALRAQMTIDYVNPRWVLGRIVDELYDREELSDNKYQRLNEDIG